MLYFKSGLLEAAVCKVGVAQGRQLLNGSSVSLSVQRPHQRPLLANLVSCVRWEALRLLASSKGLVARQCIVRAHTCCCAC